jgi:hypothetical protein
VKIIRGYKRRQYEDYRVAAWLAYQFVLIMKTPSKPRDHHPNQTMPPYDEAELTPSQRRKLNEYRQLKDSKNYMARFEPKKKK